MFQLLAIRKYSEARCIIYCVSCIYVKNPCIFTNCNGFSVKEIIVTNNGIPALLHKWPWSLTLLVKTVTPRTRHSLVSAANMKNFLWKLCSNNLTAIDNIIELCECQKA